jgi:hypothetical protein
LIASYLGTDEWHRPEPAAAALLDPGVRGDELRRTRVLAGVELVAHRQIIRVPLTPAKLVKVKSGANIASSAATSFAESFGIGDVTRDTHASRHGRRGREPVGAATPAERTVSGYRRFIGYRRAELRSRIVELAGAHDVVVGGDFLAFLEYGQLPWSTRRQSSFTRWARE